MSRVTPARRRASELASAMWPSRRWTNTGWSGVTASMRLPRRQRPRGPPLVVPVPFLDPGALRQRARVLRDPARELLLVARAPQVDGEEAETAAQEVHVRVVEAGHDEAPAEVDRRVCRARRGAGRRRRRRSRPRARPSPRSRWPRAAPSPPRCGRRGGRGRPRRGRPPPHRAREPPSGGATALASFIPP